MAHHVCGVLSVLVVTYTPLTHLPFPTHTLILTPPPHPILRYDLGNNYAGVARVRLPVGAKGGSTMIVTCTECDEDSL